MGVVRLGEVGQWKIPCSRDSALRGTDVTVRDPTLTPLRVIMSKLSSEFAPASYLGVLAGATQTFRITLSPCNNDRKRTWVLWKVGLQREDREGRLRRDTATGIC